MSEAAVSERPETRAAFVRALIAFIEGPLFSRHGRDPVRLDASTPLFETGVIDSLGIIDLLAFVERATGTQVPMRQIDMRFFGTVDRIARAFWSDPRCP